MSDYKGGFLDGAHAEKLAQQTRITELEAQLAAVQADAALYQWLIKHCGFGIAKNGRTELSVFFHHTQPMHISELSKAINVAIAGVGT
jgi:hypothetical protein